MFPITFGNQKPKSSHTRTTANQAPCGKRHAHYHMSSQTANSTGNWERACQSPQTPISHREAFPYMSANKPQNVLKSHEALITGCVRVWWMSYDFFWSSMAPVREGRDGAVHIRIEIPITRFSGKHELVKILRFSDFKNTRTGTHKRIFLATTRPEWNTLVTGLVRGSSRPYD